MPISRVPPSPIGKSLKDWAFEMTEYLQSTVGDQAENAPDPVLLPHMMPKRPQSAVRDGIMMFDPQLGSPVFSWDEDWHALLTTEQTDALYLTKSQADNLYPRQELVGVSTGNVISFPMIDGGIVAITAFGSNTQYPQFTGSGIYYFDTGPSLYAAILANNGSANVITQTGPLASGDVDDGKIVYSANTDELLICSKAQTVQRFKMTVM